jgi:hypothetical protein
MDLFVLEEPKKRKEKKRKEKDLMCKWCVCVCVWLMYIGGGMSGDLFYFCEIRRMNLWLIQHLFLTQLLQTHQVNTSLTHFLNMTYSMITIIINNHSHITLDTRW